MYLSHFNLKTKPFQITTDPKFMWMGEKHSEALATLKYGILEDKGFLLLTGDIGLGKTALIKRLLKIIDVAALVATVPDPGLDSIDFFNFLAEEFNLNRKFTSKGDFLIHFKQFLHKAYATQKKVLLIIDEAQRLNNELLEQIRLLSNIEMDNRKLINIFFVGQNEFNRTLLEERNKAVRQRITVSYQLEPLTDAETVLYIKHRLKIAGATRDIFTAEAFREVYAFSRGYPRLINIICDHALLTGYAAGQKMIDADIIRECKKELDIPVDLQAVKAQPEPTMAPLPPRSKPPAADSGGGFSFKRFALVMVFLLLLGFTGYFVYQSQFAEAPKWSMEEIAPQKYEDLLEKQPEEEVPGTPALESEAASIAGEAQPADQPEQAAESEAPAAAEEPAPAAESDSSGALASADAASLTERKFIIYFNHNSNDLPDEAFDLLDRIAAFMQQKPEARISIRGYTDSSGSRSYNVSVSQFRANSIKSYLVGKGVDPFNIQAEGLGPENPIASNETSEGRRLNRRVEMQVNVNE
jgi:general secretion pathway protein A